MTNNFNPDETRDRILARYAALKFEPITRKPDTTNNRQRGKTTPRKRRSIR